MATLSRVIEEIGGNTITMTYDSVTQVVASIVVNEVGGQPLFINWFSPAGVSLFSHTYPANAQTTVVGPGAILKYPGFVPQARWPA